MPGEYLRAEPITQEILINRKAAPYRSTRAFRSARRGRRMRPRLRSPLRGRSTQVACEPGGHGRPRAHRHRYTARRRRQRETPSSAEQPERRRPRRRPARARARRTRRAGRSARPCSRARSPRTRPGRPSARPGTPGRAGSTAPHGQRARLVPQRPGSASTPGRAHADHLERRPLTLPAPVGLVVGVGERPVAHAGAEVGGVRAVGEVGDRRLAARPHRRPAAALGAAVLRVDRLDGLLRRHRRAPARAPSRPRGGRC